VKKLLIVLSLIVVSPALADSTFDCTDLTGSWQGDRFDTAAASQRKVTGTFFHNSMVLLEYEYDDGHSTSNYSEFVRWTCDGVFLTLSFPLNGQDADTVVDTYKIVELNSAYFVYRAIDPDCEGRYGDCGEITYEAIRIPTIEYYEDGC